MDYTERIGGYQIRDVTYLFDPGNNSNKIPLEFDIVKWFQHDPAVVTDLRTGVQTIQTEYCYTIGFLVWDSHESDFYLRSVGMRWVDEMDYMPRKFSDEVIIFADNMAHLLLNNELEEATIADLPTIKKIWTGTESDGEVE